ncbi:trimeric intracellular cation channel family protein [Streptomyces sp. NPDC058305]|uniref:trimeric intracellular cation channel family protein n=1 Tax=Streptomyces sp. NPDC058305 TaxID=3346438 RepID=UPI0036E64E61
MSATQLALGTVGFGSFEFTGGGTLINLVAATTNALNGALLARRPDHYKNFTVIGILLMALLGGIGGGVSRDVLVGRVPAALTNSSYITLCLIAGGIGHRLAYDKGQLFREGLFQFVTSFALPWYAIVGAQTGVEVGLPVLGSLALAVVGPTAGRFLIDVSCGVPPKQFVRGEWFVAIAALTGAVWIVLDQAGLPRSASAPLAFLVGFTVRLTALYRGWEEPLAAEPAGVYRHDDGRPLLGRKIAGKSAREMRLLGLTVEPDPDAEARAAGPPRGSGAGRP